MTLRDLFKTNKAILLLIIFVAAVLRFYRFSEIPFTHDELSALFRTHFDTFSELIEKGILIDGHPAGIQVFLYYLTKVFGYSEPIVKFPFVVFGILSVFVLYCIAREWYNETVALISSAYLATIQYTIMYSQIARPYISGLFFSLLLISFWSKLIFRPQKKFYLNSLGFILSASLCTYNHHFSLLFSVIVGMSGVFIVQKKYLFKYLASGFLVFLLYTPHLKIFFYQLNVGGVEGWLGKPHNDFIIDYIQYIFHFSAYSFFLVFILFFIPFFSSGKTNFSWRFFILSLIWFCLPFFIGFFYSKYRMSVLQFSVLIFNFPFLFFILFSHFKPQKFLTNLLIVLAILSTNIYTLYSQRKHYQLFYNSPIEGILKEYAQITRQEKKNTLSIIDSQKEMSEYYINKDCVDTNFTWYDSFGSEKNLIAFLEDNNGRIIK